MITKETFVADLLEFVEKYRRTCTDEEPFVVYSKDRSTFAEQKSTIHLNDGAKVLRSASICYNDTYGVPVLWFNFYTQDGKLMRIDDIKDHLQRNSTHSQCFESISQNEHPHHGIAFYNIHPCRTDVLLRALSPKNYVTSWASVVAPVIGILIPPELDCVDT
ncbi:autophagocytosis associated protein domain-containing protein [Aphelenchoides avenae]|nr:autophagocytosis associated protein domain-containing protein [Aphelenchus avenae]